MGPFWGHFGVILDHFWVDPGSFCGHLGIILASFSHHVGAVLASFWNNFGAFFLVLIFGPFGRFLGLFRPKAGHFGAFGSKKCVET